MKNFFFFTVFLLFLFINSNSFASHIPGGNITYRHITGNEFEITLTLYEDCGGSATLSASPKLVQIANVCGIGGLSSVSLPNIIYQQEISQLCPSFLGQSECNVGGTYPGNRLSVFRGNVTLPGQCNSWVFSYSICCRNVSNNLNGGFNDSYFFAELNNLDAPTNSSPYFTAPPVPYVCAGQQVCYNLGTVELDGDSLAFSFTYASISYLNSAPYNNGYTFSSPIPGITIDPLTGQIDFVPGIVGNFVVAVRVEEYDANGTLIGVVVQDFTFEVINCSNQILDCNSSGQIMNLFGGATQTGPVSLEMCENVPFTFDLIFSDPDAGDSLTFTSNIYSVLPGAGLFFNYPNSGIGEYDTLVLTVSWTPPVGSNGSNNAFTLTINDNACPVSGQQTIVYYINVLGITSTSGDVTICDGDSTELVGFAEGASDFIWTALSGDPIAVGNNFSCNNCDSTFASPDSTTVYELQTVGGVCPTSDRDTLTVTVIPDFTYNVSVQDDTVCIGDTTFYAASINPVNPFTILWNSSDVDVSTGAIAPSNAGFLAYSYTITGPGGCTKSGTEFVTVLSEVNVSSDVTICPGDTTTLIGSAQGATDFIWTVVSGDPIAVGANFSCNNCDTTFASPITTTLYEVNAIGAVCPAKDRDTVVVNVIPDFTYNINVSDNTICSSDTAFYTASINPTNPFTIQWFSPDIDPTTGAITPSTIDTLIYIYEITGPGGCVKTDSIEIITNGVNIISSFTDETCNGLDNGSIDLSLSNSINGINDFTISGPVNQVNTNGLFNTLPDGIYLIEVLDDSGCTANTSITISPGDSIYANSITSPASCWNYNDGLIQIMMPNGGIQPYTYLIEDINTNTVSTSNSYTALGGLYYITISDSAGCEYIDTVIVGAPPQITASFSANPLTGLEPLTVNCVNNSSNATTYEWFVDGVFSNSDTNFSQTFNEGNYTIMLVAHDGICSDTMQVAIFIYKESVLIVPNVFTPNGDNENDVFKMNHRELTAFSCKIFNRWGRLVFETNNPDTSWDGNSKGGGKMNAGTYYYLITAVGIDAEEYDLKGNIELIR